MCYFQPWIKTEFKQVLIKHKSNVDFRLNNLGLGKTLMETLY